MEKTLDPNHPILTRVNPKLAEDIKNSGNPYYFAELFTRIIDYLEYHKIKYQKPTFKYNTITGFPPGDPSPILGDLSEVEPTGFQLQFTLLLGPTMLDAKHGVALWELAQRIQWSYWPAKHMEEDYWWQQVPFNEAPSTEGECSHRREVNYQQNSKQSTTVTLMGIFCYCS